MASESNNLSKFEFEVPSAVGLSFGIVAASWNSKITDALLEGAIKTLLGAGARNSDIIVKRVPGAYELSYGAKLMCMHLDVDAIIVLGAIIKGGTPHFDFIAQGVTQGINSVSLDNDIPIAFGVLTTNNMEEAEDRAGGKFGNKGEEAAATAIVMANLQYEMEELEFEAIHNDYELLQDDLFDCIESVYEPIKTKTKTAGSKKTSSSNTKSLKIKK